jgi:hypothetical protein
MEQAISRVLADVLQLLTPSRQRPLASGEYTVTIVAVNAAGSSAAERLSFTITR